MNKHTPMRLLATVAILGAITTAVMAAPKAGGTVYSKRNGLALYSAPNSQSQVTCTVGFAEALTVSSANESGKWLNVTTAAGSGWVFAGLTAEKKPEAEKTAGFGTVDASSSTTAAAARPLSEEAKGYAERHNMVAAGEDVDWVEAEAHKVGPEIIDAYMKENEKGEYQK